MTTDNDHRGSEYEGPLPPAMADLFATLLTRDFSPVNDLFVTTHATVDAYGSLVVDVTRINFIGDDRAERVTLMPTTPIEIPPPARADENNTPVLGIGEMDRDDGTTP